jgi:acyl-CoA synthetase (AMP-forming)/AMP-acid ligase II
MRVPLTVGDFLDRAALVFPDRVAVVDEPADTGGPASLGRVTYGSLARRARNMASVLGSSVGVGVGDRVAIVSPNSARFLTAFFGVSGWGRVLVPINFRLTAEEVSYIVDHSGATVLLVDPEQADALAGVDAKVKVVLDGSADDAELFAESDREPAPWAGDEDATASINYTSGTTARPKGVQLTHRNCWLNATTFGWHTGVSDRDVYLHTLPMFHCNGWGMPYALTGMGCTQVVQRKVDGDVILSRVRDEGVTLLCGAPAVVAAILDAAGRWRDRGEEVPGRDRVRIVVAGAPPPTKTIERVIDELGWEFIQIYGLTETSPLLTIMSLSRSWRNR